MADPSAVAFGKYLRHLRERRGLSLSRVCEWSRSSAEPFDKGTLSRLERGQQTPSIYRLGPLSRIYQISADALLERMELDRELDRLGAPETFGKTFDELQRAGGAAILRQDRKWDAYACFRDSFWIAGPDKKVIAWLNVATAIRSLGKNALALHELRELASSADLDPGQRTLLNERLSNCCRCLGDMRRAEEYADAAIAQAQELGDSRTLAYAYAARGSAAIDQEQWQVAYDLHLKSLAAYRDGADQDSWLLAGPSFEAQRLLMLAECSLYLRNMSRARRLLLAAKRLSEEHDLPSGLAYSELFLGWIDEAAGRIDQALARWRRAAALAARVDNPRIAFTAEVEIFRQAQDAGDVARARACKRRLDRLAPWIPQHIPAYKRFGLLVDQERRRAARAQEGGTHEELPHVSAVGAPGAPDAPDTAAGRRRHHPGRRAGLSGASRITRTTG